jgi:hypothetical protein
MLNVFALSAVSNMSNRVRQTSETKVERSRALARMLSSLRGSCLQGVQGALGKAIKEPKTTAGPNLDNGEAADRGESELASCPLGESRK